MGHVLTDQFPAPKTRVSGGHEPRFWDWKDGCVTRVFGFKGSGKSRFQTYTFIMQELCYKKIKDHCTTESTWRAVSRR